MPSTAVSPPGARTLFWDMTRYQWLVVFAAWLGWGFDVFDGLLFNYVAPNCVPTLLGLPIGSPAAKSATFFWQGLLASMLLLGWATGGVLFGLLTDRIGRTRTLLITMLLYAFGTAACAAAPNLAALVVFRLIASLGIGGEWAAGASMVAEVVPEKRRVEAGALLYTSAPMGLFLATFANFQIAGKLFQGSPETSWRYVFLCGLIPAAVAFILRLFIKEPERWQELRGSAPHPSIKDLFAPEYRRATISGFLMTLVALIAWWSCNTFIPIVASGLAQAAAQTRGLDRTATLALIEQWKGHTTNVFNLGGLLGTLLTIPAAKFLGRRAMFTLYFLGSGVAILLTFGLDVTAEVRQNLYFFDGLFVFGVFGAFTYYLPELFPTRLRGTGAGFCYNIGRVFASVGPFLVGSVAARGSNALSAAMSALFVVGFVPLAGLLLWPFIVETKGRALS